MIETMNPRVRRAIQPDEVLQSPQAPLRKPPQSLRFSPTAWAKLLYLRDAGGTEVGGFGIAAEEDLLRVEDVALVRQTCDIAAVAFDDQSVADYFDRQVDAGRSVSRVGRIWVHTHPGSCAQPSGKDQETFARVFGKTEWAVLFILARGGQTYARLEFHVGPGGSVLLPVEVDYGHPFQASNQAAWWEEYLENVRVEQWPLLAGPGRHLEPYDLTPVADQSDLWDELLEEDVLHSCSQDLEGGFDDHEF